MGGTGSTGRKLAARLSVTVLVVSLAQAAGVSATLAPQAAAATTCPAGGSQVTIDARDFPTGNPLASFNYLVNDDNTKLLSDTDAPSTESNSPIVAEGDQDHA